MNSRSTLRWWVSVLLALSAGSASASGISYTCDATVDSAQAGTCAYLASTVASIYNSTFSNANASIYIKMGITGLGESTTGFFNATSFLSYAAALQANATASGNSVQASAANALNTVDAAVYGGHSVVITSALGQALGISNALLTGTTASGSACTIGSAGCYNGIITVTTPANLSAETGGTQGLYWDQAAGSQPANDYDFYNVVEHETNEILGTASCITTSTSPLSDDCAVPYGAGTPSAIDLFRYSGVGGSLVPVSALSTAAGAIFSYDGGLSNGADGAVYNTLDNGDDYADFASNCKFIQDATGCLGGNTSILTDGGAEINLLNAIGYELRAQVTNPVPEPRTLSLVGLGLMAACRASTRRRPRLVFRSSLELESGDHP